MLELRVEEQKFLFNKFQGIVNSALIQVAA